MGFIINIIIASLFLIIAIVFLAGKGAFLIAGYNTASKEQQKQIDEKALCRFMGKLLILFSGCFIVAAIGEYFDIGWLIFIGITLFAALLGLGIYYANSKGRFRIK